MEGGLNSAPSFLPNNCTQSHRFHLITRCAGASPQGEAGNRVAHPTRTSSVGARPASPSWWALRCLWNFFIHLRRGTGRATNGRPYIRFTKQSCRGGIHAALQLDVAVAGPEPSHNANEPHEGGMNPAPTGDNPTRPHGGPGVYPWSFQGGDRSPEDLRGEIEIPPDPLALAERAACTHKLQGKAFSARVHTLTSSFGA